MTDAFVQNVTPPPTLDTNQLVIPTTTHTKIITLSSSLLWQPFFFLKPIGCKLVLMKDYVTRYKWYGLEERQCQIFTVQEF